MKLNHFQQAEVNSHNDAELLWLIQSSIEFFKQKPSNLKNGQFNRFSLYKTVAIVIADTIAEREGFSDKLHKLTEKEAAHYLWSSYSEKFPKSATEQEWKSWEELIIPFMDSLIYQALLRTRVPLQEYNPIEEYWPFGQEGGFCNPNKQNMITD